MSSLPLLLPQTTTPDLCVKKAKKNYDEEMRRPCNIRTFGALCRTMDHLLEVLERRDHELISIQAFLWDRSVSGERERRTLFPHGLGPADCMTLSREGSVSHRASPPHPVVQGSARCARRP